jgi:hypothetical protein
MTQKKGGKTKLGQLNIVLRKREIPIGWKRQRMERFENNIHIIFTFGFFYFELIYN